jgi:hypothetical protein
MSIASIASKKACSGASAANTGKLGCLSLFGTPAHMLLFQKGYVIPAETNVNVAWMKPLVQKGIITPLIDSSAFEDVSGTDSYSTNTKGVKRLNLKGLPEYKLMFEEGHEFYRELSRLESFKSKDAWIGDTDGNWMVVKQSDGDFSAFSAGHITPELTKRKVEGGDAESKSILVQFLNRLEWDKNYEILHAEELDFIPQEVPTINGVVITMDAIPAAAATTVDFTVVLASDKDTLVAGLVATNFAYAVNGVVGAMSVVENSDGKYTGTITAVSSAEVLTIATVDAGTVTDVADSNGVLYRNSGVTSEVVA